MSILSAVKSYIKEAANNVSRAVSTVTSNSSSEKPNAVVKVSDSKLLPNEDMYKSNGTTPVQPDKNSKASPKAVEQRIQNSCMKYGINWGDLKKLLPSMLGLNNMEEFYNKEKISEDKQLVILGLIGAALDRAGERARNNKSIDLTQAVIVDLSLTLNALNKKVIKNEHELKKLDENGHIQAASNSLLENINSLSGKDLEKALNDFEKEIKNFFDEKIAEIERLPKNEQAAAKQHLEEEMKFMRERIYNQVLQQADTEHAANSITIVKAESLPNAARNLYKTRRTPEERMKAAKIFTFNHIEEKVVKRYHDKGDMLSANTYSEFVTENVSHMDSDTKQTFENDYFEARQNYAKNGYPEYMNEEMFIATASGIAAGTQINEFMTAEEKANSLNTFYANEEKNFNDADKIRENANKIINDYNELNASSQPESGNKVKKGQEITQGSNNTASNNATVKEEKQTGIVQTEAYKSQTNVVQDKNGITNPINTNNLNKNSASSDNKIKSELSNGNYEIKTIAENNNVPESKVLKIISTEGALVDKYRQEFVNYITQQHKDNDLLVLANSLKAIELITKYNTVDNKDKLNSELKKKATSIQKNLFEEESTTCL